MKNKKAAEAERIIVIFLDKHPSPAPQDWKELIESFPQYAKEIADAAMVRDAGDAADASSESFELDTELANRTVSRALNKIHQLSSRNLELVQDNLTSIKKPAKRRQVAIEVGIGPHTALLNGILSGRTKGPSKVLKALATMFDVPTLALEEFLKRCFEETRVPSFKGGDGKPKVAVEPVSWEDAVRGLNLAEEETRRLLKLSEED